MSAIRLSVCRNQFKRNPCYKVELEMRSIKKTREKTSKAPKYILSYRYGLLHQW